MLNRTVLIGRLTKDPELRYSSTGTAIANFTLAVERQFKNQNGEKEADFINIVTFKKLAENVANYLKKGRLAAVEGRIQTRSFENNEGRRIYVTEVIADNVRFLESNGQNNLNNAFDNQSNINSQDSNKNAEKEQNFKPDPFTDDGTEIDIADDDLPF